LWFLGAGLVAVVYYGFSRNPSVSAVLATTADVIGYYSTLKKGWFEPHRDDDVSFLLNSIKFFVALPALESYSVGTCLYPATIGVMNFVVFGILRFRQWHLSASSPNF
jgi:hypothetical protein